MAIKVYLFAFIARHVLYALGPIFLTFALFTQTRSLFDGYIEQLINFSLQPVFLFIFLGLFHSVLAGFASEMYLEDLTDAKRFSVDGTLAEGEEMCIGYTKLDSEFMGKELYFYRLCKGNENDCYSMTDLNSPIPIDIWVVIAAIIVCYLMFEMTTWVVQVASRLSSGMVTLSDIPIQGFNKIQSSISGGIGSIFKGGK